MFPKKPSPRNLSQDIGLYNRNYSNTRPKVSEISAPVCTHYPTTDPPPFTECFCIHLYLFAVVIKELSPETSSFRPVISVRIHTITTEKEYLIASAERELGRQAVIELEGLQLVLT